MEWGRELSFVSRQRVAATAAEQSQTEHRDTPETAAGQFAVYHRDAMPLSRSLSLSWSLSVPPLVCDTRRSIAGGESVAVVNERGQSCWASDWQESQMKIFTSCISNIFIITYRAHSIPPSFPSSLP